jgi:hypothetical protein
MAVVQSTYLDNIPEAVAGMPATMDEWDGVTYLCETVAGIGFGLAVGRGTADKGAVLGGTLAKFVGVSQRDITLEVSQTDKYVQYQNMSVRSHGTIWVVTSGTAPTPADPVHYSATTGVFAITGGTGPIVGARWRKTGANNLALLHIDKADQLA